MREQIRSRFWDKKFRDITDQVRWGEHNEFLIEQYDCQGQEVRVCNEATQEFTALCS